MKWFRLGLEPLTGERQVLVENAKGEQGFIRIRWKRNSPQFYGSVFNDNKILDPSPTITTMKNVIFFD